MALDALLAIVHHLAVFSVVAILVTEWVLLRPGLTDTQLRLVGKIDGMYGAMSMLAILAGIARLVYGAKGWSFYSGNPMFWAKMTVFVLIGGLSSVPTVALLKWRRTGMPSNGDIARLRVWLNAQLMLLPLLPVFAVLMARGIGMG
jgi:putative membrane protein